MFPFYIKTQLPKSNQENNKKWQRHGGEIHWYKKSSEKVHDKNTLDHPRAILTSINYCQQNSK